MTTNITQIVDNASSLIQSAQGGFELGNSANAYNAYTNALNLAGTMAGSGPWGVGLNAAAVSNNTLSAYNSFQTGGLQPHELLQITGSALSLVVAAAAISGAPITLAAVALAGTIGIVAGPGPLQTHFNEFASRLGAKMMSGIFGSTEVDLSQIAAQAGGDDGGGSLVVRQYDTGAGELITLEFINNAGWANEYGGHLEGGQPAADVTITHTQHRANGTRTLDIQYNTISTATILLSGSQLASGVAFGQSAFTGGYSGNTVDFGLDGFSATGLGTYSLQNYLGSGSAAYRFTESLEWFSHEQGSWHYQQYWDPDAEADWHFNRLNYYSDNVLGETKEHERIEELVWSGVASPIVIDLNGDGIHSLSMAESQVEFDVTGDTVAERTGWLGADDGFLVLDKNSNGVIESVNEMFGSTERGAGFAELAALDSNRDGKLSAEDQLYSVLQIWRDGDSDGRSLGELMSLSDAGILSIDLAYHSVDIGNNGNRVGEVSSAETIHGPALVADLYFRYGSEFSSAATGSNADATVMQMAASLIEHAAAFDSARSPDAVFSPSWRHGAEMHYVAAL